MQSLKFDEGYREFCINDDENRVIRFNPSDIGMLERFSEAKKKIYSEVDRIEKDISIKADGTPEDETEEDPELIENDYVYEKTYTMLGCLYEDFESIPPEDINEAIRQAIWYLDGGNQYDDSASNRSAKKVIDWEQDEQIIFSAVNKVAGLETRSIEYIHWWTFLGYFNEVGEGLLTTIINIRSKKNKGKKLEKYEEDLYKSNRLLIELKAKYTPQEQAERDYLNELLG